MLLTLSRMLTELTPESLPPEALNKAKMLVLNFVGGGLPGADAEVSLSERALWNIQGSTGTCTVLGQKGRTAPLAAAAVNACMGQVFLEEDCHEATVSHPGVIVIPAALAVGQAVHASGGEVLAAVAAGFECMGRIGKCLIRKGFSDNGLRPAAILGPFGAACAAAKLLKLGAEGMRNALSIAGNTAAGFMEFTNAGTADICIQNCYAAKCGIMAAYEAKAGLAGAPTILEGRFGLGMAFNDEPCDWSSLTAPANEPEIMDTYIKMYPGCGHVLPTAQAITQMLEERNIRPEEIRRAVVGTRTSGRNYPGCDNKGPFNGTISAMTSHQFMVAAGVVFGRIDVQSVKQYGDSAVTELAKKIDVVVDPKVEALAECGGRLTLELTSGEVITNFQERTFGLSDEGVVKRLRDNSEGYYSPERTAALIEMGTKLEELSDICLFADLMESDL